MTDAADREVHIERLYDAPREAVFRAFTDPALLARWYAPTGCTISFRKLEVRPGGAYHSVLRTPTGKDCCCIGTYREVVPPARLVFTMVAADADGRPADPVALGMDPAWPRETLVTVTLEPHGRGTRLTLRQSVLESLAKRTGAHPSWLVMLDRLAETLPVPAAR